MKAVLLLALALTMAFAGVVAELSALQENQDEHARNWR